MQPQRFISARKEPSVRAAHGGQYGEAFRISPLTAIISPDAVFDICGATAPRSRGNF